MTTLVPQKTGLHEISHKYVVNFDKENGLIMETGVLNCFPSLPLTKAAKIKELEHLLSVKIRHLQHADRILEQERKDNCRRVEEIENLKKRLERSRDTFEYQYKQIETLKRELSDTQEKLENTERQLSLLKNSHKATNEENSDDVNLQLPSAEPDTENNRDFIRNNRKSKCAVCLEELINSEKGLISVTPCGHRFHITCIERWINTNTTKVCPTCRTPIDSQSLTFQTAWDNNKKLYSCFNVKLT
jgi:hypothetical protein